MLIGSSGGVGEENPAAIAGVMFVRAEWRSDRADASGSSQSE
jgi:hypothetical protein